MITSSFTLQNFLFMITNLSFWKKCSIYFHFRTVCYDVFLHHLPLALHDKHLNIYSNFVRFFAMQVYSGSDCSKILKLGCEDVTVSGVTV